MRYIKNILWQAGPKCRATSLLYRSVLLNNFNKANIASSASDGLPMSDCCSHCVWCTMAVGVGKEGVLFRRMS